MATDALIDLINSIDRPSIILSMKNKILACNPAFIETFGNKTNLNILEVLGSDRESISLSHMLKSQEMGWQAEELPLQTLNKGSCLFWIEIYTNEDRNGDLRRMLTMHDMAVYRQMEAAYLSRVRHVTDDNLWILNKKGILIWAKTNSPELNAAVGLAGSEVVYQKDLEIWEMAFNKAKRNPGTEVSCTVRSKSDKRARILNIFYFSGGLFDGRFYVASRSATPAGRRIVKRLKEAWQLSNMTELAEKLETTVSAINSARDKKNVPPIWLTLTAEKTGASLDWLCYGQGEKWRNARAVKDGDRLDKADP